MVQAAAMRCVEGADPLCLALKRSCREPGISPALRAVAVQDIDVEILLRDPLFVVAGAKSRWARRRKVELGDLANDTWMLPPLDTLVGSLVADVFRKSNLEFPPRGAVTGSIHLCSALVATGPFLAMFPGSVLRLGGHLPPLKVLPVRLPTPAWPVGLMTLKNRTPSPVTKLFIDCLREVTKPLARQAL